MPNRRHYERPEPEPDKSEIEASFVMAIRHALDTSEMEPLLDEDVALEGFECRGRNTCLQVARASEMGGKPLATEVFLYIAEEDNLDHCLGLMKDGKVMAIQANPGYSVRELDQRLKSQGHPVDSKDLMVLENTIEKWPAKTPASFFR